MDMEKLADSATQIQLRPQLVRIPHYMCNEYKRMTKKIDSLNEQIRHAGTTHSVFFNPQRVEALKIELQNAHAKLSAYLEKYEGAQ